MSDEQRYKKQGYFIRVYQSDTSGAFWALASKGGYIEDFLEKTPGDVFYQFGLEKDKVIKTLEKAIGIK